jgi:hypothetical protein
LLRQLRLYRFGAHTDRDLARLGHVGHLVNQIDMKPPLSSLAPVTFMWSARLKRRSNARSDAPVQVAVAVLLLLLLRLARDRERVAPVD